MSKEIEILDSIDKVLANSLEAPALDPILLSVANEHLAGTSISDIASNYNVAPDIISQILDKKEVKSYVDNVYLSQGYMNRHKRMKLINQVIENKMIESMETQVFTKKDLLDWLKMIDDMEHKARPKDNSPTVAIQVNNNYTELMERLMKNG